MQLQLWQRFWVVLSVALLIILTRVAFDLRPTADTVRIEWINALVENRQQEQPLELSLVATVVDIRAAYGDLALSEIINSLEKQYCFANRDASMQCGEIRLRYQGELDNVRADGVLFVSKWVAGGIAFSLSIFGLCTAIGQLSRRVRARSRVSSPASD